MLFFKCQKFLTLSEGQAERRSLFRRASRRSRGWLPGLPGWQKFLTLSEGRAELRSPSRPAGRGSRGRAVKGSGGARRNIPALKGGIPMFTNTVLLTLALLWLGLLLAAIVAEGDQGLNAA